jgi:hypothetical protein
MIPDEFVECRNCALQALRRVKSAAYWPRKTQISECNALSSRLRWRNFAD